MNLRKPPMPTYDSYNSTTRIEKELILSELPIGWVVSSIGELCTLVNGRAFKPQEWTSAGLPIVRIQNLNRPDAPFNYFEGEVAQKHLINDNDLLFAWSGTPGTSFGAHIWQRGKAVLNQHIFKICFDDTCIDRNFFMNAINQTLEEQIAKAHGGVGLRHVTKGKFQETKIFLPPIAEQKRIVAKITSLTSRLGSACASFDCISSLIEKCKVAIVDSAFAAMELSTPLLELVDQSRGIPYGIVQTGRHQPDGIPTVRAGDIKNFGLLETRLKRVSPNIAAQYGKTILQGGEVLIAIRGSVGETSVVPTSMKGTNISREVALIPVAIDVNPSFIMYFLKSSRAVSYIKSNIRGIAQTGINLRDLKKLPCPNISIVEQLKTIERIKTAFALLDSVSADHTVATKLLFKLETAILSKAFNGRLVPQSLEDEPAHNILVQIAEQKKRSKQQNKRRSISTSKIGNRKPRMSNLIDVLKKNKGWMLATEAARILAVGDGSTSDAVESFYSDLRSQLLEGNVEVERRGDDDWLRFTTVKAI